MAYLYLDESGKFQGYKQKRSIVGGFFIKDKILTSNDVANFFRQFNLESEIFHGNELSNSTLLAVIDNLIDFCKQNDIIPIIFIPQRGFYVINDTKTYLHVLAEGIFAFIKKKSKLFQDISELTVTIEHRVGIKEEEYKERINELVTKAIVLSPLPNRNIKTKVEVESKKNYFLQLADAIVHTFYRLDTHINGNDRYDQKVVEKFNIWIEQHKIYIHASPTITEKINNLMNDNLYEYALKNLIDNALKDNAVKKILPDVLEQLCKLNIFYINSIFSSLLALYYNAINEDRILKDLDSDILFIIENILPRLEEKLPDYGKRKEDIHWIYTYCYMILLTLYNHKGDVHTFEDVYRQAYSFIKSIPFDLDYLSARLRIKVLYGVHLTNMYAFEWSFNEMHNLEKKVSEAFSFLSESDENIVVQPRILGEIIGTKLQAKMYHTLIHGGSWEEVRDISKKALQSFVQSEDIMRQYQYCAQIETYTKNFEEARRNLAKGCGVEYHNDMQLLEDILKRSLLFPLLHFLRIYYVELMNDYSKNVKKYYEIVTTCFNKYKANVESMVKVSTYPVHSIYHYVMVLYGLYGSNSSIKQANDFYNHARELCMKNENVTILTKELSIRADYIWLLSLKDSASLKSLQEEIKKIWHKVLQQSLGTTLYDYLVKVQEKYKDTPVIKWNTLWYLFPF